ncbi:cytochrome p450, partial [Trifolium pratense]
MGTTNTSCVFCGAVEESVDHLFVSCDRISHVWYRVSRWVGMEYVSPNSIIQVFESFLGLGVEHRVQLGKNPNSLCTLYEWEVQPLLCRSSKA